MVPYCIKNMCICLTTRSKELLLLILRCHTYDNELHTQLIAHMDTLETHTLLLSTHTQTSQLNHTTNVVQL